MVVEPWIDGLWLMIWKHLEISPVQETLSKESEIDKENSKENIGQENTFCLIMENDRPTDETDNVLEKNTANVSPPEENEVTSEKKVAWSMPSQEFDGKGKKCQNFVAC